MSSQFTHHMLHTSVVTKWSKQVPVYLSLSIYCISIKFKAIILSDELYAQNRWTGPVKYNSKDLQ